MDQQLLAIFSKPNRYIVGSVALIIMVLASVLLLIFNRGFYFADYNVTYSLQFDSEISTSVIDSFSGQQYVSYLNREARSVDLQGIPGDQLNQKLAELRATYGEDQVELVVSDRILPTDLFTRVLTGFVVSVVAFLGFSYYSIWRKTLKVNSWVVSRSTIIYGGVMLAALLIHAGLLSLVSLIYELRDVSFAGLLVSGYLGIALAYILQRQTVTERPDDLNSLGQLVTSDSLWLSSVSRNIMGFALVVLSLLILGLGNRYLVDAVLIWFGILVMVYALKYLPSFVIDLNDGVLRRVRYAVVEKDPDPTRTGDEYLAIEPLAAVNKQPGKPAGGSKSRKAKKKGRR